MNLSELKAYYNTKPVEYIPSKKILIKEDKEYIPRFRFNNIEQIANVNINEPIKPSIDLIVKAIKYGMIFLINYKGEKDIHFSGHERVVQFMVIGRSEKGKVLIRGYHLNGWSVSGNAHINKVWRMFRLDRILSLTFTGSFYRLPPTGYNMNDKGMLGGIIARADFSEIRRNQQSLVKTKEIQNKEEIKLDAGNKDFTTVKVKSTTSSLDLNNPMDNIYLNNMKDAANLRMTFLKSIYGNVYLVILNALGKPGNTVKLIDDKNRSIGVYKVLDSISGDTIKKIKKVKGNTVFGVYVFNGIV